MIQKESRLEVADNSGAKVAMVKRPRAVDEPSTPITMAMIEVTTVP